MAFEPNQTMPVSMEQMQAFLQQQRHIFEQSQAKLVEMMTQKLSNQSLGVATQGQMSKPESTIQQCLKLTKNPSDDWVQHAGDVNQECERSKRRNMTDDQFNCLILVCGLHSHQDTDIRARILNKIEQCSNITQQSVTTEGRRLVSLKHDIAMIQKATSTGHPELIYAASSKNQDVTFQEARDICEQKDDVNATTADLNVTLFQKTKAHSATRGQPVNRLHAPIINPGSKKVNKCFSCGELHLRSSC
ncbi:uncharacterized protein DEA37_0010435 [Paragonimus westermani]|uniref:Uncharacterized protein n=1 Tax=Paragonimus westermani TaxID=34504 RepID=A0A5J4P292_9TREM|nr:uncharacterized protein DEA37_0010435 [Paragonimus westermani]